MVVYFRHLTCNSLPFDPTVVSNRNFSDAGCLGFRHDMKPENSFNFGNIHSFSDSGAAKMVHWVIHIPAEHYSNINPNHNTALPWEVGEEYGFQEETNDAESQLHSWSLHSARLDSRVGGVHFSLHGSALAAHGIENDEKALGIYLGKREWTHVPPTASKPRHRNIPRSPRLPAHLHLSSYRLQLRPHQPRAHRRPSPRPR